MRTGAEKPRNSEGVAQPSKPSNTTRACAVSKAITSPAMLAPSISRTFTGASRPSGATNPSRIGITSGSLSGWPGVGGVACVNSTAKLRAAGSYSPRTVTVGVPAWEYQRMKCVRSRPEASAKQAMKFSTVAAVPSQRRRYRSMPCRNASSPIRTLSIRITSAPFS